MMTTLAWVTLPIEKETLFELAGCARLVGLDACAAVRTGERIGASR